jgi:hypothetical protein
MKRGSVRATNFLLQNENNLFVFLFFLYRPSVELMICERRAVQMYSEQHQINLKYGVSNVESRVASLR